MGRRAGASRAEVGGVPVTAPTRSVRADMYERDLNQCPVCGRRDSLTHGHRRAVGMGGSKKRPSITDSLTLCLSHNERVERDLQIAALFFGWKVRRWVKDPGQVPVFYPLTIGWARLTEGGAALPIHADEAAQMMRDVYGEEWESWRQEAESARPGRT